MMGNLLELVDCVTWRKLQSNITMQLFLQFGKVGVIDREGPLNIRDWEGQNYLKTTTKVKKLNLNSVKCDVKTNLSITTRSASCASKEDWSEAFSVVVEVFDQQKLLVQLKHGAGNFVEECCEVSQLSGHIW